MTLKVLAGQVGLQGEVAPVVEFEHHVAELDHCVAIDLGQGDDVLQIVDQLVRGLAHGAEVVVGLKNKEV